MKYNILTADQIAAIEENKKLFNHMHDAKRTGRRMRLIRVSLSAI